MKVDNATGAQLDWMVAKCEGMYNLDERVTPEGVRWAGDFFQPSKHWSEGGPIIEREAHNLFKHNGGTEWCCACNVPRDGYTAIVTADGPTPLIAAMRCYVASKLGDEVDVPDELI